MNIPAAIGHLEQLKARLGNTRAFFIDRLSEWVNIAESTARSILATRVPDGIPLDEWTAQVNYTIGLIGAQLLGGEASGILLYLGREQTSLQGFTDIVTQIAAGELTLGDIEDYVTAGMEGDPLGKPDITEEDRNRTAVETAFIVRKAIASGKSNRDEAIIKFITQRNREAVKEFYPGILSAWIEVFSIVAHQDLRAYVQRLAAEF